MRVFRGTGAFSILTTLALVVAGAGQAQALATIADIRPGAEAKFVELTGMRYDFTVRRQGKPDVVVPFTPSTARMFYSFQPATSNADTAPLYVFLNGGPGAATSANFFSNNTAPYTLNLEAVGNNSAGVVANPHSWTRIGNLLYIDPAQSGFSYNVSEQVFKYDNPDSLRAELYNEYWSRGNLNPWVDADQILRVILTFLKSHPEFATREVVMVGESYGGVRVSTILHMLMNSAMYDTGGSSFFHDPDLAAMIREQFGTGQYAPTAEQVSDQFDRQILVQPQLSSYQGTVQGEMYWDEDSSIIDELGKAHSRFGFTRNWARCAANLPPFMSKSTCPIMVYIPQWGLDRYDYGKKKDYSDKQDDYVNASMRKVAVLTKMLGVDPLQIPMLAPAQRKDAYHTMGEPIPGEDSSKTKAKDTLADKLGVLQAPDSYYVSWNQNAYLAATIGIGSYTRNNLPLSPDSAPLYGDMFLENLRYVKTFLTDAKRDLVIYSPALPEALKRHAAVKDVATFKESPIAQGQIEVTFKDSSTATIEWPHYEYAGHAVAMTMPDKLLRDVDEWMDEGAAMNRAYARWAPGSKRLQSLKAKGVRVTMHQPGGLVKKAWLFRLGKSNGVVVPFKGTMKWHAKHRSVKVKGLEYTTSGVSAQIAGKRVRLLSNKGKSVRITGEGARALNTKLKMSALSAGQPMGRLELKP